MDTLSISASDIKRFEKKFVPVPWSGCWIWTDSEYNNGYGRFRIGKVRYGAHRAAWLIYRGYISHDLHIDHKCSERLCVNPDHLEPVTPKENIHRTWQRGRGWSSKMTHCHAGHAFNEENTYLHNGIRYCRRCRSENELRYYYRRKRDA